MVHLRALNTLMENTRYFFNRCDWNLSVLAGLLVVRGPINQHKRTKTARSWWFPVQPTNVPIYSEWIGTTDGMVNAEIKAQVTGYLLKTGLQRRFLCERGQLLFEIDPRPFRQLSIS
jgi:hypothetical protein